MIDFTDIDIEETRYEKFIIKPGISYKGLNVFIKNKNIEAEIIKVPSLFITNKIKLVLVQHKIDREYRYYRLEDILIRKQ